MEWYKLIEIFKHCYQSSFKIIIIILFKSKIILLFYTYLIFEVHIKHVWKIKTKLILITIPVS